MAAFTDQVSGPATTAFTAVQRSFNTEVDKSTGDLIGSVGGLVAGTASLVNEIGTASLVTDAQAAMTQVVEDSVTDKDFYKKVKDKMSLPAGISDTVAGKLKQQAVLTEFLGKAGSSIRRRAAVQQAATDVFGATPTQSLVNIQDTIAGETRRAQMSATLATLNRYKAAGIVGKDNQEIMKAGALMEQAGGLIITAGIAGKNAGTTSSGTIRANLIPKLNAARNNAHKFAMGPLMSMLERYSTASIEDKAVLAATMGNALTSFRGDMLKFMNREIGGTGLSPKEFDYILKPTEDLFLVMGKTLGITSADITEGKAVENLSKTLEFGLKITKMGMMSDALGNESMRKLFLAKEFGGDVYASALLSNVASLDTAIESIAASSGRTKESLVTNTLDFLIEGNKKASKDVYDSMVGQKLGIGTVVNTHPSDIKDPEIVKRNLDLIIGGTLQNKTVANQDRIVEIMGGGNGLAWINAVKKTHPEAAEKAVTFFIETANRGFIQAQEELAHAARDAEHKVVIDDGRFSIEGDHNLQDELDQANKTLTSMMKFKEFTNAAKTGEVTVRKVIIERYFVPLMKNLNSQKSTPFFESGLSPEEFAKSGATIKIGKPWFLLTDEEKAAQDKYFETKAEKSPDSESAPVSETKRRLLRW